MRNKSKIKEYKEKNFCLDINSIKTGKTNINWILQINPKYAQTEKDKKTRLFSKNREKTQIVIKEY